MAESFEDVYRRNYQRLYTLAFLNAYRAYDKFCGESSVSTAVCICLE